MKGKITMHKQAITPTCERGQSEILTELKKTRISLNLTQEQMAGIFGVTPNTLARWERGDSSPDGLGMLSLALEALQAKHLLKDVDFLSKKEAIKQSLKATNSRLRQRVRHPKATQFEKVRQG